MIGAHDGEAGGTGGVNPHFQRWFEHHLLGARQRRRTASRASSCTSATGSHGALRAGQLDQGGRRRLAGAQAPRWRALHLDARRSGSRPSRQRRLAVALDAPAARGPAVGADGAVATRSPPIPYTTATVTNVQQSNLTERHSLTYTTPPLSAPVMAVGPAALKVRLSSTVARDRHRRRCSPTSPPAAAASRWRPGGCARRSPRIDRVAVADRSRQRGDRPALQRLLGQAVRAARARRATTRWSSGRSATASSAATESG